MFNNSSGGTNLFGNNSGGSGTSGSLFSKPQTQGGGGTTIFGGGQQTQQGQPNIFGNKGTTGTGTGGGSTLFGGGTQQQQTGGTLFNTQGGGTTTMFGGAQGSSGSNLFSQTGQTGTLFGTGGGTGTQYGQYGSYGQPTYGQQGGTNPAYFSQVNEGQFQYLLSAPQDQQKKLFESFQTDYIKNLIAFYRKSIEPSKVEKLQIGSDNPLRNEKISKVAGNMNIKKDIIQVKRLIKESVVTKVAKLKDQNKKMEELASDFSKKVFDKLQRYKEKLVFAVSQKKMIQEIKRQVEEIDQQIKEFFKPLFNAYQNRNNHSFTDPDPFCLKISEMCLKNMTYLDNKMDELLACESESSDENLQTAEVIRELVEYYENVAITVKDFTEKFNNFKRKVAQKSNQANPDDLLRKITDKANKAMNKDMESYELVKEIEALLYKRDKRIQGHSTK